MEKHSDFQMLCYGQHVWANKHKRGVCKDNLYFKDGATSCERWDQSSFDPAYDKLPLDFFLDMVRATFERDAYDPAVIQPDVQVPLQDAEVAAARA